MTGGGEGLFIGPQRSSGGAKGSAHLTSPVFVVFVHTIMCGL